MVAIFRAPVRAVVVGDVARADIDAGPAALATRAVPAAPVKVPERLATPFVRSDRTTIGVQRTDRDKMMVNVSWVTKF